MLKVRRCQAWHVADDLLRLTSEVSDRDAMEQITGTFTDQDGVLVECVVYAKNTSPGDGTKTLALVDTGADISAVDQDLIVALGIHSHSASTLNTASGHEQLPLYICALEIPGLPSVSTKHIEVAGWPPESNKQHRAIIGRDILSKAKFIYDSGNGTWTLMAA